MDWVVMAMGGWGGTVEEVGLFVAHKVFACGRGSGGWKMVSHIGVDLASPGHATVCIVVDVPSMGYCMCNDDGAIFGRVNVQPARQKS